MRSSRSIVLVSLLCPTLTLAGPCDPATLLLETDVFQLGPGTDPRRVIAEDLNQDGALDLIVAQWGADRVSVLLGVGDGTFNMPVVYTVSDGIGDRPQGLSVADYNMDGHLDLAIGNGESTVSIMLGDGTGALTFGGEYDAGFFVLPSDMISADLDHDNDIDIVVSSEANSVYVLLNNGDGSFAAPVFHPVINGITSIANADINNDTNPDVVVAAGSTNKVFVLYGNGAGSFSTPIGFDTIPVPFDVQIGDMDNDGDLDLVVCTFFAQVAVHLNNGSGNFSTRMDFTCELVPADIKLGDMDSDGDLDVMVATLSNIPASIAMMLNDGTGVLSPQYDFLGSNNARGVAIGDFNGDSGPDVAAVYEVSNFLHIYLNQCPPNFCGCNPADLADPCGVLNFFDVSAYLTAYLNQDPLADFNGDSLINFFDVSLFLTAFNNGCP